MKAVDVHRRRRRLLAVGGVTLLGALLRFSTLDRQSFWSDEAMTVLLTQMSLGDMLTTIGDTESTPPLYYVLAWAWAKAFGHGEIGLRSLSALAGTAAVPMTFVAGSRLLGYRAAIASAGFVAVSPLLLWYSQEARSYALAVLFCGVSFTAFTYVVDSATTRAIAVWAVASLLAIATHYFALFVVGAEVLWLLAAVRRPAARWAAASVVLCATGISLFALEQRSNRLVDVIAMSGDLSERVVVLAKQLLIGSAQLPGDRLVGSVVALLVAVSLALATMYGSSRDRRAVAMAAAIGGAAVVAPIALAVAGADYVNTRNAQVGMVPLAVAMTAGLAVAAPRRLAYPGLVAGGSLLLVIGAAVAIDPGYHRSDWRGLASAASDGEFPRAVVVSPDHQGWFARVPLQVYMPRAHAIDEGRVPALPQFDRVTRRAADRASPRDVVVREVVLAGVGWEQPELPQLLPGTFNRVEAQDGHGYSFVRFRSERLVTLPTAALVAPDSALLRVR